jgi:hypothetical protein
VPDPSLVPPEGYQEILDFCGNIARYIRKDGTVSPSWESEKIGFARLPAPMVAPDDLDKLAAHPSLVALAGRIGLEPVRLAQVGDRL